MDVLSAVMCLLRTKGHVYGRMELSGRFGLKFPNQNGVCLLVTRGSCFLNIDGGELVPLVAGDFVFVWGETFYLRSDKNIAANKTVSAEQKAQYQLTKRLAYSSGTAT